MNTAARGVKRHCTECDAAFYDMQRRPIRCPKCGAEIDVTAAKRLVSAPRQPKVRSPRGGAVKVDGAEIRADVDEERAAAGTHDSGGDAEIDDDEVVQADEAGEEEGEESDEAAAEH